MRGYVPPPEARGTLVKHAPVHWVRGGSVSDRIVACPGYANLAKQYPADPSGDAAIEGTHDHTLLETCIKHGVWDAKLYLGEFLSDHDGQFHVSIDRIERVNMALEYVSQRTRELDGVTLHSEIFVDAGTVHRVVEWGGSLDIGILHSDGWEVIDYKGGYGLVEPTTWQLQTYAMGLCNRYPGLRNMPGRKTIIQPKRWKQARWIDVTPEQFTADSENLIAAMRRSTEPDAPRIPGDHCRYCRGAKTGRCPEWNAQRGEDMRNASMTMTTMLDKQSSSTAGSPLTIESVGQHTSNEDLVRIIDAEPIVLEMIKEAKAEALRRARNGVKLPNRKLIKEKGREKWSDTAEQVLMDLKVPRAQMYKEVLKTPKQLRETEAYQKMGARRRMKIEDVIYQSEDVYRVVLLSDRGVEVSGGLDPEKLAKAASAPPVLPPVVDTPKPQPQPAATPEKISFF